MKKWFSLAVVLALVMAVFSLVSCGVAAAPTTQVMQGEKGDAGVGVADIISQTDGAVVTLTFEMTDGSVKTATIPLVAGPVGPQGPQGPTGLAIDGTNGTQGPPGADGQSIHWLGQLDEFPTNPQPLDAFFSTQYRNSYIWNAEWNNGEGHWDTLAVSGDSYGVTGPQGPQGLQGPEGPQGEPGVGIASIEQDGSSVTFYMTDESSYTIELPASGPITNAVVHYSSWWPYHPIYITVTINGNNYNLDIY